MKKYTLTCLERLGIGFYEYFDPKMEKNGNKNVVIQTESLHRRINSDQVIKQLKLSSYNLFCYRVLKPIEDEQKTLMYEIKQNEIDDTKEGSEPGSQAMHLLRLFKSYINTDDLGSRQDTIKYGVSSIFKS